MKKTHKPSTPRNRGYALLITVVFVGIGLLLLGSVMNWTNSSARQTERNNLFSLGTGAAEAADENVIAYVTRDFYNGSPKTATNYTGASFVPSTASWPVTFSFSNSPTLMFPSQYSSNLPTQVWAALGWQFQGSFGIVTTGIVTSTATALNQPYAVSATVQEQIQLATIPLAQKAIFYNMNMEICPGATMSVNGPTYVNGQIYADPSSGTLTFAGPVNTTMPSVIYTRSPNDQQSSTANPSVVYTVTNSPMTNSPALVLPVGTNSYSASTNTSSVASILDLPPPGTDPNSALGQEYVYNEADIIISNSSSGTISAFYQNSNNVNQLTPIPYNMTNVVGGVTNKYYSFATNVSFYDYRESDTVKAVQINVGAFNTWLSGPGATYNSQNNSGSTSKGHSINSLYVYNSATLSSTQLPAVRMANGGTLPSQGLTVATPDPLYVLGNYNASGSSLNNGTNVVNTAPAGLMGDAITILSTSWSDTYSSSTALSSRTAGSTTVNAATLEGIVESTTVNGTKHYSGGVENFMRLLENWSNKTLTYNGSIIVLFDSRFATNFWNTPGSYYNPPARAWGFDVNFQTQGGLPPIFPSAKAMIRQNWTAY
ncbi:MAG TPA: hypothetical protein VMJ12_12700 [Candidatus Acidoferrales bacterium]|nr:hypothetical protein [Candidatus Acidoferrales bacterium]